MAQLRISPACRRSRPVGPPIFLASAALLAFTALPLAADTTSQPVTGSIITIAGPINNIVRDSLQRRIDSALNGGAQTLVFELNTPGGLAVSALDICRMIKSVPAGVRTVAWVHPQAYSAGAIIALACNEIWMSPASSIGDAAPIALSSDGGLEALGKTERAKAESPILQEVRDSVARNGYNNLLARSMVTLDTEVWWVRNIETGEQRFVNAGEKEKLVDQAAEPRKWTPVEEYTTTINGQACRFQVHEPIAGGSELLTMSGNDAVAFGFAKGIVANTQELSRELNLVAAPARLDISGWEQFAVWLNSPIIRGILLVIVLLGAYLEFHTPGVIAPGITAVIALIIFLAAPYAAGLAGIWTILLLVLGLVLVALEIFVLPGFGAPGIIGGLLVIAGLLGSFVPTEPGAHPFSLPKMAGTWYGLMTGLKVLSVSTLTSLAGMLALAQFLPRSRLARGIVAANPLADALVPSDPCPTVTLGDLGVVTGDLRPGGQARFGHQVIDVCSQGEYVPAGRRVQVIRREGLNVVVRALPDEGQA